jgi:hypothetical protein
MRRGILPLADAPALWPAARRSAWLRAGVTALVAAFLAGAALAGGEPDRPIAGLLPSEGSTIIVLDFSTSVSDLVYRQIAVTLHEIVETSGDDGRIGLVLFSDTAEEALPPGTPPRELVPFIRFFEPKNDPGAAGRPKPYRAYGPGAPSPTTYPLSPWFRSFSGGTQISTGLRLAREAVARDRVSGGRVLLLSDLEEAREDAGRLTGELAAYARNGIALGVVALPPATERDMDLYRRALGESGVVEAASLTRGGGGIAAGPFPARLVLFIALVAAALAAWELLAVPLRWRRPPTEAGT